MSSATPSQRLEESPKEIQSVTALTSRGNVPFLDTRTKVKILRSLKNAILNFRMSSLNAIFPTQGVCVKDLVLTTTQFVGGTDLPFTTETIYACRTLLVKPYSLGNSHAQFGIANSSMHSQLQNGAQWTKRSC